MTDAPARDAPVDAMTDAAPDAMVDAGPVCPLPIIRALSTTDSYDGTLSGASTNATTSCQANAAGPENYFSLHLDARTGLIFSTEAARTTIDTIIEVRRTCDDPLTAIACDDDSGRSTTSLLRDIFDPGDYVVIVDEFNGAAGTGAYNLTVSTFTPAYDETQIAGSCDDVSTGTVVPGVDADDSASALIALPFTFRFFGTDMTQYSVTSNGFMQLWDAAGGTPSASGGNVSIPDVGTPNGYVAPFWDDLDLVAGETTEARALTVGTAPNQHLTIQWTNWTNFNANSTRLTFQAKLFQTTGVIELHYCTLTPGTKGDRATGNSATVGLESPNGMDGMKHSVDRAMAVSTANGIRFTPR